MSGIYLVVWDQKERDQCQLLQPTRGGWPHITLVHTCKNLPETQLLDMSKYVLGELLFKTVTIIEAYVSSFKDKLGNDRHDVLLKVQEKDLIESVRDKYIRGVCENYSTFIMRDPHITYGNYETLDEAEGLVKELNTLLPHCVQIVGVTLSS